MSTIRPALVFAFVVACGCSTTVTKDGVELTDDEVAAIDAAEEQQPTVDYTEARIDAVIEAVGYDRGPALLRNLQWLITQGELAVPKIIAALERSDTRTTANLLYVLGFSRTKESTTVLAEHLAEKDTTVRFEAAAGLLQHGDTTAVPVLVDFLENPDKRFRYKAIEALRTATGRDFGYSFSAPEEIRNASVSQWRTWWGEEKQRLMYRPWAELKND